MNDGIGVAEVAKTMLESITAERDALKAKVARLRSRAAAWKKSARGWLDWATFTEKVRDAHFEEAEQAIAKRDRARDALRAAKRLLLRTHGCECGSFATRHFQASGLDCYGRPYNFDWPRCDACEGVTRHNDNVVRERRYEHADDLLAIDAALGERSEEG